MPTPRNRFAGPLVYVVVVVTGTTIVAAAMRALDATVDNARGVPFVLASMWMPALARLVAVRTADREWRAPFPIGRWGAPRSSVILVPLLTVTAIYLGAYALASLLNVPRSSPVWPSGRIGINVAVNLPLLSIIGMAGALGEELGWRGYLQPRLDQLNVPYSLMWMVAIETLFHLPLIVMGGYLAGASLIATVALFAALGVGLTPVWTWATYRWRTVWIAVLFHTFHNAVSQVLVPRALGEGSPLLVGESGLFPVLCYLAAALLVFLNIQRYGRNWAAFARSTGLPK